MSDDDYKREIEVIEKLFGIIEKFDVRFQRIEAVMWVTAGAILSDHGIALLKKIVG